MRSVEPWGTLLYRSYRTRLPVSRRPLERAEGGGAGQRGPRKEFPAQGQTATARGCSGGKDEDRVVGFFQPRGSASAGVTIPIFPEVLDFRPLPGRRNQARPGRESWGVGGGGGETKWMNHAGCTWGHRPRSSDALKVAPEPEV